MDKYYKDETGQWWCETKRQRLRVVEKICPICGTVFPTRHYGQKHCSKACTGKSQRGPRRPRRRCQWCKQWFQPRRTYSKTCSKRCAYDLGNTKRGRSGPDNVRWKGGTKNGPAGYVREYVTDRGYLLQHRLVMERIIGRRLERHEEVHHKNGIRHDNRPANLELWIKRQPGGARVKDLLEYARWILQTYGPLEKKGKLK